MKDSIEYQIFNARGRMIHAFDDRKLAMERLPNFGIGCYLVEARKTYTILATNKPPVPVSRLHLAISA